MGFLRGFRFGVSLPFYILMAMVWHLGSVTARSAEAIESWAEYPRPAGAGALTSIAFGNGIFVAVGANGTIVSSSNGMDWTKVNAGVTGASGRVRFVNDRFFVWGFGPVIMSTDGNSWTQPGIDFSDITFANGTYYAVLWTQLAHSTNLVDWTYYAVSQPFGGFSYIAYGNGSFAANDGGRSPFPTFAYSGDGLQWNRAGSGSLSHAGEITHQNGSFFAVNL